MSRVNMQQPFPSSPLPGRGLRPVAAALAALARGVWQRLASGTRLLNNGRNDGPPDLDELWRDFNRKLSGLFSNAKGGLPPSGNDGPGFQPDMKGAGIGVGLIAGVVGLIWLGSGVFIVQEGEQAVVTTFGVPNKEVAGAGIQWRDRKSVV